MKNKNISPWAWIPTLYFAQGLPYVAVMTISVIMYKNLGISNTDIDSIFLWNFDIMPPDFNTSLQNSN